MGGCYVMSAKKYKKPKWENPELNEWDDNYEEEESSERVTTVGCNPSYTPCRPHHPIGCYPTSTPCAPHMCYPRHCYPRHCYPWQCYPRSATHILVPRICACLPVIVLVTRFR
jgi:hypothetical protein